MHGVIAKKDGTVVDVQVGDDPGDPVFCVTDLLIHLAGKQMAKKANEVVEGEDLDILVGNRPYTLRPRIARRTVPTFPRTQPMPPSTPTKSPSRRSRSSCWPRSTALPKTTSCRPKSRWCPPAAHATWGSTAAW